MAGSLKWFEYTTKRGDKFAIRADESNVEAVNGTEYDFTSSSTAKYGLPKTIEPRTATYSNGTRTITVPVMTETEFNALLPGDTITDPIGSGSLTLIRLNNEKERIPFAFDTGITDGDET